MSSEIVALKGGRYQKVTNIKPLKIEDLQQTINILLSKLKLRGIETVDDCDSDYYWQVEPVESFDMNNNPEVMVGSLVDDLKEISKFDPEMEWVSPIDLERVAHILLYLSKVVCEQE